MSGKQQVAWLPLEWLVASTHTAPVLSHLVTKRNKAVGGALAHAAIQLPASGRVAGLAYVGITLFGVALSAVATRETGRRHVV